MDGNSLTSLDRKEGYCLKPYGGNSEKGIKPKTMAEPGSPAAAAAGNQAAAEQSKVKVIYPPLEPVFFSPYTVFG